MTAEWMSACGGPESLGTYLADGIEWCRECHTRAAWHLCRAPK